MTWKLLPDRPLRMMSAADVLTPEEAAGVVSTLKGVDHRSQQLGNEFSYSYILMEPQMFPEVYERLTAMVLDCNVNNYNFKLHGIPALYYVEFDKSQFMDWSMDLAYSSRETNKLSVHVALNDDYEGGDFLVRAPREIAVARTPGTATLFPSFLASRQDPTSRGIKKAILGTISGLPFS